MKYLASVVGTIGVMLMIHVFMEPGSQPLLAALAGALTTLGFLGIGND